MEANQRRYTRNLNAELQFSPKEPITKEQIRKALVERRTIIGPNGEKFEIPKHMSLDDMARYFKSEFNLTHAEVTQVVAAAEWLILHPNYRGKLNRVVMDGSEPLRIQIPEKRPEVKKYQTIEETLITNVQETPKPITPRIETVQERRVSRRQQTEIPASRPPKLEVPTLEISVKNPSRDGVSRTYYGKSGSSFDMPRRNVTVPRTNSYTVQNPDAMRRNENYVNRVVADRMRAERQEERRLEAQRAEQNKNLEKQMRSHYQEQAVNANRKRRNRLALVAAVGFLWMTGLIVDVVGATKDTAIPVNDIEPIGIHESSGKLFDVTPQTISNFTGGIDLIPTSQKTNTSAPTTLEGYQPWEYSIDTVSQGLNQNSNLANVLIKYSQANNQSVAVGEIASYQELEQLLQSDDEALYTSGPAYFANFSRQMLHGMLKDKYGAERVAATYEKTGENEQNYEFYIRYFKSGSSSERTPEGRVTMTRNAEGRLQTNEYHTLPYEVYEILTMVGEFSDFSNKNGIGPAFDVVGYAERFTNGDVEKAKEELKGRMAYGMDAMKTLLKDRVRSDKVDYYRYDR